MGCSGSNNWPNGWQLLEVPVIEGIEEAPTSIS